VRWSGWLTPSATAYTAPALLGLSVAVWFNRDTQRHDPLTQSTVFKLGTCCLSGDGPPSTADDLLCWRPSHTKGVQAWGELCHARAGFMLHC